MLAAHGTRKKCMKYTRGSNETDRLGDYLLRCTHVSSQHMVQNVNITSALLYVGVTHPSQRKWLIVKGAEGKKF